MIAQGSLSLAPGASPAPRLAMIPRGPAWQAVAGLQRGGRVIGLTKGQFSMLDLLAALLEQTGPASVSISTWTMGIRDTEGAALLLDQGRMTSLRLYVDRSFPGRQPAYCAAVQRAFGAAAIRMTRIHAKIATIVGGGWSIAVRSSMNLNRNPRFEQFDIDDDARIVGFFAAQFDEMSQEIPPGTAVADATIDAVYERIGRGVNPFDALDDTALLARGIPIDRPRDFGTWARARTLANRRDGRSPATPQGLASAVGVRTADVVAVFGGGGTPTLRQDIALALA